MFVDGGLTPLGERIEAFQPIVVIAHGAEWLGGGAAGPLAHFEVQRMELIERQQVHGELQPLQLPLAFPLQDVATQLLLGGKLAALELPRRLEIDLKEHLFTGTKFDREIVRQLLVIR
jgi:hypothetical protein